MCSDICTAWFGVLCKERKLTHSNESLLIVCMLLEDYMNIVWAIILRKALASYSEFVLFLILKLLWIVTYTVTL